MLCSFYQAKQRCRWRRRLVCVSELHPKASNWGEKTATICVAWTETNTYSIRRIMCHLFLQKKKKETCRRTRIYKMHPNQGWDLKLVKGKGLPLLASRLSINKCSQCRKCNILYNRQPIIPACCGQCYVTDKRKDKARNRIFLGEKNKSYKHNMNIFCYCGNTQPVTSMKAPISMVQWTQK